MVSRTVDAELASVSPPALSDVPPAPVTDTVLAVPSLIHETTLAVLIPIVRMLGLVLTVTVYAVVNGKSTLSAEVGGFAPTPPVQFAPVHSPPLELFQLTVAPRDAG